MLNYIQYFTHVELFENYHRPCVIIASGIVPMVLMNYTAYLSE